jgi:multiple sugar transport system permease protein
MTTTLERAADPVGRRRPVPRGPTSRTRDHLEGWAFASPAVVLIGIFGLFPVLWSFWLSFQETDLTSPGTFTGTDKYARLVQDPLFWDAAGRTALYAALFVPATMALGLPIAVLLNQKIRGIKLYRMAVFVPLVTSTVATGIIFSWLFNPQIGFANAVLSGVGLPEQGFFQDPGQALFVMVAMTVWGWLGFAVIIYLAALQNVPGELMEAAALDGCGRLKVFRHVELPLVGPASAFLLVWLTINSLQLFDEVYVTTKGGPLRATTVLVYYLYNEAFVNFDGGYAAAVGCVLFVVILAIALVQLRIGRRATPDEVR